MLRALTTALGVTALCAFGGAAHAATYNLDDGGAICEGPESLLPNICFEPVLLPDFADGPSSEDGPTINLTFAGLGSATVYGGVRGKNNNEFADRFQLSGNGFYKLTLTLLGIKTDGEFTGEPGNPQFDATWTMDDAVTVGTIGNQTGNSNMLMGIFDLTGGLQFELDAAGGAKDRSYAEYRLDIEGVDPVQIDAVPLPAAAWMLIAGVGGLGALSRIKKKTV